LLIYQISYPSL